MSSPKRYDPINSDGTCGTCVEDPDYGAYVEFADYAALEAERETLRAENERLRQELAQSDCALRESRANDMANVRTLGDMWERHEALRQELENVLKRREA